MKFFTAILFCIILAVNTCAQDKYSTKVKLMVTAPDEIKSEVQSYLSRELRALGDVTIVEAKPSWSISVIVLTSETTTGRQIGFAFATLITQPLHTEWIDKFAKCDDKTKESIRISFDVSEIIQHFDLQESGSNELQLICKRIIAGFDSKQLEPDRKSWQRMVESIRLIKP